MVYAATKSRLKSELGEDKFVDELQANEPVLPSRSRKRERMNSHAFVTAGRSFLVELLRRQVLACTIQP